METSHYKVNILVNMISFESFPLWVNALIYIISAGAIWQAGYYLEKLGGVISNRTVLGQAFIGLLLISLADTLPEIATTVTAVVFLDNPTMAVHNLLGGVALQVVLIVAADWTTRESGAFTFFTPNYVLLVEGVGLLVLLQVLIVGVTASGVPMIGPISIWPIIIFFTYILVMYLSFLDEDNPQWTPTKDNMPFEENDEEQSQEDQQPVDEQEEKYYDMPINKVWMLFAGASAVVLFAGWGAANASDMMAEETGLSHAFMGATFLALASSLPELSTITNASRDQRYSMAMSNIFGGCALNVGLLFLLEILYLEDTIMILIENSVIFIAAASAVMVCTFLWGLMERENKTVFKVGWDSAACLIIYLGTMTVLYFIT